MKKQRITTKEELARFIIPEYERVLCEGKKDSYERFQKRLVDNFMWRGICYFILHRRDCIVSAVVLDAVRDYGNPGGYWCAIPYYRFTKKDMVDVLQRRIDILNEHFLNASS